MKFKKGDIIVHENGNHILRIREGSRSSIYSIKEYGRKSSYAIREDVADNVYTKIDCTLLDILEGID